MAVPVAWSVHGETGPVGRCATRSWNGRRVAADAPVPISIGRASNERCSFWARSSCVGIPDPPTPS